MNVKKLNEEITNFLSMNEANGIAISGKNKEVGDLLNKLTLEYGDLTIPEFIDKLIQAEQDGQDILHENLNESLLQDATNCPKYSYWTEKEISNTASVHGTLSNALGELLVKANNKMFDFRSPLDDISSDYYRSMLIITLAGKTKRGRLHVVVDSKSPATKSLTAVWDLGEDFIDNVGFGKFFKPIEYLGKHVKYGFILASTLARYTEEGYMDALQDLQQQIISKLTRLEDSIEQEYRNADKELEELEKARREAKANKNAKNTTMKQALSKSAIARKIQALQNPTPEQLAKILAAIEEQ